MQGIGFDDSDRSALNFGDWSPAYELDTVQAAHTDLTVLRSLDFLEVERLCCHSHCGFAFAFAWWFCLLLRLCFALWHLARNDRRSKD